MQYEIATVLVPAEYTKEAVRKFRRAPVKVIINYSVEFKNEKPVCQAFYYGTLENHHRSIIWCDGLYSYLTKAVQDIENAKLAPKNNMEIAEQYAGPLYQ